MRIQFSWIAPTFFFALLAILTLYIAVLGFRSSTQAKKIQTLQSEIVTLRQRFKDVCVPPHQFLGLRDNGQNENG
jgi:hypothetical protein